MSDNPPLGTKIAGNGRPGLAQPMSAAVTQPGFIAAMAEPTAKPRIAKRLAKCRNDKCEVTNLALIDRGLQRRQNGNGRRWLMRSVIRRARTRILRVSATSRNYELN
jgi:hypothetical protein